MDWQFNLVWALATFGLFCLLIFVGGALFVAWHLWQMQRTMPREEPLWRASSWLARPTVEPDGYTPQDEPMIANDIALAYHWLRLYPTMSHEENMRLLQADEERAS